MIKLNEQQHNIYSQLLDLIARNPTDSILGNIQMRFGKTPLGMKLVNDGQYKRVVVIIDQPYQQYIRLLPSTHLIMNETIYFINQNQIKQIVDPDFIIIDDINHTIKYLDQFKCPKLYMYGIMNEDFENNIKKENIVYYTYQDYINDGKTPLINKMKTKQDYTKLFTEIQKLDLIDKHIILVVCPNMKKEAELLRQLFGQQYCIIFSNDMQFANGIISKQQRSIILCTELLYKNVSIPICQVVIFSKESQLDTEDCVQGAFRCMMQAGEGDGKKKSGYVCYMNKQQDSMMTEYFGKHLVNPKVEKAVKSKTGKARNE